MALVAAYDHGPLTFLAKYLGKRATGPGCHPPVDLADIITRLVGTEFLEVDATPLVLGYMRSGHAKAAARLVIQFEGLRHVPLVEQLFEGDKGTPASVLVLANV
jgi:hypothetical protein